MTGNGYRSEHLIWECFALGQQFWFLSSVNFCKIPVSLDFEWCFLIRAKFNIVFFNYLVNSKLSLAARAESITAKWREVPIWPWVRMQLWWFTLWSQVMLTIPVTFWLQKSSSLPKFTYSVWRHSSILTKYQYWHLWEHLFPSISCVLVGRWRR